VPEIQIAPSNTEFMNYSISTDAIVNHTDDLVAKARALDWGPDATNPKYVNMDWLTGGGGNLYFNIHTAPNYKDPNTRFFQRRVIGFNTDSGFVSVVSATRFQLPGLDPKDYPIIIGAADQYFSDSAPITEGNIKDAVDMYLKDMNYTLYEVSKTGPVQGDLAEKYFQAHPEKLEVARDVFSQLDLPKSNFSAIKSLDGMVLPFTIGKVASGNPDYQ